MAILLMAQNQHLCHLIRRNHQGAAINHQTSVMWKGNLYSIFKKKKPQEFSRGFFFFFRWLIFLFFNIIGSFVVVTCFIPLFKDVVD